MTNPVRQELEAILREQNEEEERAITAEMMAEQFAELSRQIADVGETALQLKRERDEFRAALDKIRKIDEEAEEAWDDRGGLLAEACDIARDALAKHKAGE